MINSIANKKNQIIWNKCKDFKSFSKCMVDSLIMLLYGKINCAAFTQAHDKFDDDSLWDWTDPTH